MGHTHKNIHPEGVATATSMTQGEGDQISGAPFKNAP